MTDAELAARAALLRWTAAVSRLFQHAFEELQKLHRETPELAALVIEEIKESGRALEEMEN